ncbi:Heat shock protein beta-1 [Eumeta japonica]|uniref:Heat shock protein beta-1 n=1 Tax=Eumeta variegata TaxID=151549 RepID=A0A4C1YS04_EUMVA|nr:Heat shock protein beta-1 [Eumeta japonica]
MFILQSDLKRTTKRLTKTDEAPAQRPEEKFTHINTMVTVLWFRYTIFWKSSERAAVSHVGRYYSKTLLAPPARDSATEHRVSSSPPMSSSRVDGALKMHIHVIRRPPLVESTSTTSTQHSDSRQLAEPSHWDSLNSPLIQDEGDGKSLKLRFDVSQYTPEEIVVKTVDNKLLVHAKHEEKSDTKSVYREYNREFLLPKGTNPEAIKSSLSRDGVLTVEAPLPQLAITDRNIPIQKH